MKKFLLLFMCLIFFCPTGFCASLNEMIGQMVIVGFYGDNTKSKGYKKVVRQIEKGQIGGVIIFKHNIKNKEELLKLTSGIKNSKHKYTPFISVDQEGGYVQRLDSEFGFDDFKTQKKIAQSYSKKEAYLEYFKMAKILKEYNFNLNFTPCVDIMLNENSMINDKERSFGATNVIVETYAKEVINAHFDNNIITTLKHFPGIGSSVGDTHSGFVNASDVWDEKELEPYKNLAFINNLQAVMVSHIFIDKLDKKYPASLSNKITTGLLRDEIGYRGVIITDDLNMGAIKDNYSLEETVVLAINAGCDILLFSNFNKEDKNLSIKIRKIVKNAIKDGKLDIRDIEKSYMRILSLKTALKK